MYYGGKTMIKKLLLISLLALTIILAGCGGSDTSNGFMFDPFIGGSQGLVFEFVPGMPPTQEGAILDRGTSSFSVGMKITNIGEDDLDINELRLDLRGILPEQFGITWPQTTLVLQDPLNGAKKNMDGSVLGGQFTTLAFEDLSYLPDTRGDLPKTFRVDACYSYQTKSTTPVCIANDVTGSLVDTSNNPICRINRNGGTKNSGAPLQISNFRQMPQGGNKVSIMFDVVHVGTGKIYAVGSSGSAGPSNCDTSQLNPDRNKVWLQLYLPDQSAATVDLSCMGSFSSPGSATESSPVEGQITLFEGELRTITCTLQELTTGQDIIYEDLLSIDLHYNYGQSFDKTIVIKDVGSSS
jgi:hypothetical protein